MKNRLIILSTCIAFFTFCETKSSENEKVKLNTNTSKETTVINIDFKQTDENLNNILGHKTFTKLSNDTLCIDLFVNNDDYVSENYLRILFELVACSVSKNVKKNQVIKITECLENGRRNETPEIIDNAMLEKILSVNNVKIYYDFKKYIVNNIKGEKIGKFNMIIEHLIKNRKSKRPNPLKENDFVQAVMSYATYYCLATEKDDFYIKLLLAIKETAQDKELWSDFNPADIDYFLNYKFN